MKKNIKAFQGLRFIAFLMIFMWHAHNFHNINYTNNWATLGVSFFIILSGFLNGYKYFDKYDKVKLKDIKELVKRRVGKFYKLHILTLALAIPLSGIRNAYNGCKDK